MQKVGDKELKAEQKKPEPKRKIVPAGIRGIVRVAETDLDGTRKVRAALLKIKGIGQVLASAIPRAAGIDGNALLGSLSEEQVSRLESAIKNPASVGIPSHLLNRRVDPAEGKSKHLVSSTLTITQKFDIDAMKKIRCYKGIRHELGLPVRGQRTRSSFRTGMVAGVTRAKVVEAAKAAKAPPAKPGAPAAPAAQAGAAPAAAAPAVAEKKEEKK